MLVSVITPAFNAWKTLSAAINSVNNQTFKDWEMIVIDDGSTDGTLETARKWVDWRGIPNVKFLRQTNAGVAAARNKAINEASGRYIAFLDADDSWLSQKLEKQLDFMRRTGTSFSFTGYRKIAIKENGQRVGKYVSVPARVGYSDMLKTRPIICSTVIINREFADPHMPDIKKEGVLHEDLVCWLGLMKNGIDAYGLDEDLCRYSVIPGAKSYNKIRSAAHVWRVYREHERLSLPYASWYFANYAINSIMARV